ncbi:hypothetical protein, partial [Phascolarctobacterium faecium]|uniref:hypothetical protein n=1 Tax=Phascolarctobacterium faecium TaxID=33025 RepID=UPI003AB1C9AE
MKANEGFCVGYNVQTAVDAESHMIAGQQHHVEVTSQKMSLGNNLSAFGFGDVFCWDFGRVLQYLVGEVDTSV